MALSTDDIFATFPDDVTTAPLATIRLKGIISNNEEEKERLFDISTTVGLFYLDMMGCEDGEAFKGSNETFKLMEKFYKLPVEEKLKYDFAAQGKYFGYEAMSAEAINRKGTRHNEIYN